MARRRSGLSHRCAHSSGVPGGRVRSMLWRTPMVDLLERVRKELGARISELRPLVRELDRLERVAAALARAGVRAVPGVGPRETADAETQAKTAKAPRKRAPARSAKPSARGPSSRSRGRASRRKPAPRGQTQAKVLAALSAAPGSTAAAAARDSGMSTNVVGATISRLVKQGRVRRLDQGGYAVVEASAEQTAMSAASPEQPTAETSAASGEAQPPETPPAQ